MTTTGIEEKLGWNVFKVDEEPHIIINQEVCQSSSLHGTAHTSGEWKTKQDSKTNR